MALLLAALAGIGGHWAVNHYRERPRPPVFQDDPRLRFHSGAFLAREAVSHFRALPPNEQRVLKADLRAALSDLESWSRGLPARAGLVCLGERHDDTVRRFLALQVLPRLDYRVLMLETGEDGLGALRQTLARDGRAMLLGARIDQVMRAVSRSGVPARLVAIDENEGERRRRTRRRPGDDSVPGREETLTRKSLQHWQPGERAVILMGALHCRNTPGWLFHRLAQARPADRDDAMLAAVVLARSQETGARLLYYVLEEMGIHREVLVVPDVSRFPREVLSWLPQVADAFAGYRSVLLFDDTIAPRSER